MAETGTADRISAVIRDVTGSMIAVGKNIIQIKLTFYLHGISALQHADPPATTPPVAAHQTAPTPPVFRFARS